MTTPTQPTTTQSVQPQPDYILSMKDICAITGLSRHTIYRMVDAGQFPAPAKVGVRNIGWRTSAINDWLESRFGSPQSK